mmetsp:Transcript_2930/g.7653  ORF Transcript_2930/g.7653 Transcript_2930/m.7653 type:complete len:88 (+) Transcript_2930:541-804(+)
MQDPPALMRDARALMQDARVLTQDVRALMQGAHALQSCCSHGSSSADDTMLFSGGALTQRPPFCSQMPTMQHLVRRALCRLLAGSML